MKIAIATLLWLPPLLSIAACGDKEEPKAQPSDGRKNPADDGHGDHGERIALGRISIGDLSIQVFRLTAIVPGEETEIDLDFEPQAKLPEAMRGWIGVESSQGSMRMRFEKEQGQRMHGHVDVPSPLPAGSRLWLELESPGGPVRASLELGGA